MGSTPKETTTTTKTEPWAGARPYLLENYANAAKVVADGTPNYFPNSTVVGWSQDTADALHKQRELATDPGSTGTLQGANWVNNSIMNGSLYNPTAGNTFNRLQSSAAPSSVTGSYESLMRSGVPTSATGVMDRLSTSSSPQQALGTLNAATQFRNDGVNATVGAMSTIGNGAAQRMQGQEGYTNDALFGQTQQAGQLAGATNEGLQRLRDTADGKYLDAGNPYLTKYLENQLGSMQDKFKQATAANNSAFAGSGRLGSNAYANARNTTDQTYSDSMAKTATDLAYNNYNAERQMQEAAKTQIGNFYNTDVANRTQALANLASTSSNQQGLRQDAINGAGNLQNAFSSLLLGGANQLGNQQVAESGVRTGAANSWISADQNDRQLQLSAANARAQTDLADRGLQLNATQARAAQDLNDRQLQLSAANAGSSLDLQQVAQRQAAALNAGTVYDNLFKPIDQQKGVGTAIEQQQGAYLQDAINRWNSKENATRDNLAWQNALLNGGNYSTSSTTTPLYSNKGSQIAGLAGSALGAAAKMCDERLKQNIEPVGFTRTGVPLYCFTYRDDPEQQVHMGPMAQEVAAIHPEAVVTTPSGYLAVNFDKLARAQTQSHGNAAVRIY